MDLLDLAARAILPDWLIRMPIGAEAKGTSPTTSSPIVGGTNTAGE